MYKIQKAQITSYLKHKFIFDQIAQTILKLIFSKLKNICIH